MGYISIILGYTKEFTIDINKPRTPSVAVASGSSVFIYRNMRPFYKFILPVLETDPEEQKIWVSLAKCQIDIPVAVHQFHTMRY